MTRADGDLARYEKLYEIEAIKTLKARYLRLLDDQDWSQWRTLLTDDVEALYDEGPGVPTMTLGRSADDFAKHLSTVMAGAVHVHHAHSPEIELTSAIAATGTWAMSDVVQRAGGGEQPRIMWGRYRDRYAKGEDGLWRVAHVHVTRQLVAPVVLAG